MRTPSERVCCSLMQQNVDYVQEVQGKDQRAYLAATSTVLEPQQPCRSSKYTFHRNQGHDGMKHCDI